MCSLFFESLQQQQKKIIVTHHHHHSMLLMRSKRKTVDAAAMCRAHGQKEQQANAENLKGRKNLSTAR